MESIFQNTRLEVIIRELDVNEKKKRKRLTTREREMHSKWGVGISTVVKENKKVAHRDNTS